MSANGAGMGAVRLGKVAIAVAMAMFSVAALYVSALIGQRQETLNRVSRYNVAWSASQAVAELGRLEHRVAAYGLADGGVARDEVELRFDVLLNRLQLLDSGEVKAFADSDPELISIVDELEAAVHDVQRDMEGIDKTGAVRRVL